MKRAKSKDNPSDLYLGIDIGGTTYKAGVLDADYTIIYKEIISSASITTNDLAPKAVCGLVESALSQYPDIRSIGIGFPAIIAGDKMVFSSEFEIDIIQVKNFFCNKYKLPVALDTDSNAAAYAEMVMGNGAKYDNFVYFTLGTGVGVTIIINKSIFKGEYGTPEGGNLIISSNIEEDTKQQSECQCTIQDFVGKFAILELSRKLANKYNESLLNSPDGISNDSFDVANIANFAAKGDFAAILCLQMTGKYLGIGIASIANLLSIPHFIIGGGISQAEILIQTARQTAADYTMPTLAKYLTIENAYFNKNTGIVGAASIGRNEIYNQKILN
ncbi:MAG: ROK family protein [Ignavibacteria bacterium]|jgi:glucokinase|nr:ROK family protein [Ignavibacteria bacterium]